MSRGLKLSHLERRVLSYAGIDAAEVADAEHLKVAVVRRARERRGRQPETGLPTPPGRLATPDRSTAEGHTRP